MRAFFRGEEIGFREGTFKDDMPEGISVGRDPIHNNIFVNEYKEGRCFGKGTVYKFGKVQNCFFKDGKWKSKEITPFPEQAFYTREGKALTAVTENSDDFI